MNSRVTMVQKNSVIEKISQCSELLMFLNTEELFIEIKKLYSSIDDLNKKIDSQSESLFVSSLIPKFETLSKSYTNVLMLNQDLYLLMEQISHLFRKHLLNEKYSVGNKTLFGWLHIDTTLRTVKIKKSHQIFRKYGELKEGELRWRIGNFNEKRYFTYSILTSKNKMFMRGFEQESPINKKLILEFEAIFTHVHALRQKIRFIDSSIVQSYDVLLTINTIHSKLKK